MHVMKIRVKENPVDLVLLLMLLILGLVAVALFLLAYGALSP